MMFSGLSIDGVDLGEWLEDDGIYERYEKADQPSESVWICTECESLVEDDECACELDL